MCHACRYNPCAFILHQPPLPSWLCVPVYVASCLFNGGGITPLFMSFRRDLHLWSSVWAAVVPSEARGWWPHALGRPAARSPREITVHTHTHTHTRSPPHHGEGRRALKMERMGLEIRRAFQSDLVNAVNVFMLHDALRVYLYICMCVFVYLKPFSLRSVMHVF